MKTPIALCLVLTLAWGATAHAADEPAAADKEKTLLVKFERYGGFAGFHDNLSIYSDFSFELGTPPHVKHVFRGSLSDADKTTLVGLLKGFGTYLKEHSDGPRVADGMRTRLEINGTAADKDAKGDEAAINRLLHQIATAAKRGERFPKVEDR